LFRFHVHRPADTAAALWACALGLAAAIVSIVLWRAGYSLPPWWVLVLLAGVAAAAERQNVVVGTHIYMCVSFVPFLFAAVAFGPLAALIVGALANLSDFRSPYLRWAVYTPARALTGALVGLAASAVGGPASVDFRSILLASLVAATVNFAADAVFNTLTLLIRRRGGALSFVGAVGPLVGLSLPLYVPLIALLVYAHRDYSLWVAAFFLLPTLALQRLIHLYQRQREATEALAAANVKLERANLSFASALVAALDARDQYTAGHSASVAVYAREIASELSLSETDQELAHLCGLLHDIGKVGVQPGILEKEGPLTPIERALMEEHPVIGERILEKVEDYHEIARVVRHHHERFDGAGYPDRSEGSGIPLLSRIIAVADAYDAMTSDRPYRLALTSDVARSRLLESSGSQFDPAIVGAFCNYLAATAPHTQIGKPDYAVEFQRNIFVRDDYPTAAAA